MDIFQALILGVVEGLTEFLPVSSTGHLIIVSKLLGLDSTNFLKSFDIAIQLGAIGAVALIYWRKFLVERGVWQKVLVAFLPTGVIGFALYKLFKQYLADNLLVTIGALFVGGLIIIALEKWLAKRAWSAGASASIQSVNSQSLTYRQSFTIGIIQSLAIIPGVSRSGATIIGGLLMGLSRATIVEFSFLLAIPTMLAATGYDLLKNASAFSSADFGNLAVGFVASFAVAYVTVKFFLRFVQTHDFTAFGYYRIIVAALIFLWVFA